MDRWTKPPGKTVKIEVEVPHDGTYGGMSHALIRFAHWLDDDGESREPTSSDGGEEYLGEFAIRWRVEEE